MHSVRLCSINFGHVFILVTFVCMHIGPGAGESYARAHVASACRGETLLAIGRGRSDRTGTITMIITITMAIITAATVTITNVNINITITANAAIPV